MMAVWETLLLEVLACEDLLTMKGAIVAHPLRVMPFTTELAEDSWIVQAELTSHSLIDALQVSHRNLCWELWIEQERITISTRIHLLWAKVVLVKAWRIHQLRSSSLSRCQC